MNNLLISSSIQRQGVSLSSITRGKKPFFQVKKHTVPPAAVSQTHQTNTRKLSPQCHGELVTSSAPFIDSARARVQLADGERGDSAVCLAPCAFRFQFQHRASAVRKVWHKTIFFSFLELQFTPPPFRLYFHSIPPSLYLSFIHRLSLTFFHSLHLPLWIYIQRALKLQLLLKKYGAEA